MYYFASDMHLGSEFGGSSREREQLLIRWLEDIHSDARAIFLVGDILDFWYEYKYVVPKGFVRFFGKLAELTDKGVEIHIFIGNHDMWMFDYLEKECNIIIHRHPEILNLYGKRVYCSHGDEVVDSNNSINRLRSNIFRSKTMRWLFSRLIHPDIAMWLGNKWSKASRNMRGQPHIFRAENEPLVEFARDYLKSNPVDWFVFGHMHCTVNYDMGNEQRLVFIGEWMYHPAFAVMSEDGNIELKNYK